MNEEPPVGSAPMSPGAEMKRELALWIAAARQITPVAVRVTARVLP